jgi:hypothetical protein
MMKGGSDLKYVISENNMPKIVKTPEVKDTPEQTAEKDIKTKFNTISTEIAKI